MNNHKLKPVTLLLGLTLGLTNAHAEDEPTPNAPETAKIEELFVLGERRAYQGNFDALESPTADQFMNEELLRDAGSINLDEALDLSASVARQNNFGGMWNSFSIRGFSGDINLPSGFLVNGFNAGRGFGGPRDLVGIASVEVLKGPRSALFGRGEPGGTINLVTKRPNFETGGYLRGSVGEWNHRRVEGDYQTVLGESENLGLRLVGFYEDSDSFREPAESEKVGFYPSLNWKMSDQTSLTYDLEYTTQELPFDRGVVYAEEFGFSPRDVFVGENVPIETEVVGHQFEFQNNLSDNWSFLGGVGFRETSLNGDAFEPQFGSRQTYFQNGQTISRFFRSRDFDSEYFVLRGELAGEFNTGELRHRVIFGIDYDKFDNTLVIDRYRSRFSGDINALTSADLANDLILEIDNPVYGANLNPLAGANTNRNEVLKGYGIYIQDQIDLNEKLQIRLGARFDDFEQDLTNRLASTPTTITSSDDRFSPQVGAVYRVSDGLSLYASYGEGYRQQTGQDFQGNQFDPNITESAEIGLKVDLGEMADTIEGSFTMALFQIEQSNFLVNDDRPAATAVGFFSIPAGKAESTGLELDAYLKWDNGLSVWTSYAYTDAKFTNSFADADGFGFSIDAGDPVINSPEHQLNIQTSKELTIQELPFRLGGGVLYTGERNGFVGSDFTLPDYTTFRMFAEIKPVNSLSLRLDVDNVLDETFYTNSYADVWVGPGAPRRWRMTMTYSF
ncbi:TonB-dependent receptor [Arenicella chitinivorans]|uniref:TonB-dependent receptor n=1 Tax=Arenicella chitinivorans TaxID=1329800 RepID=A0A918VSX0_9GAMM|nr:TonB-dependent receptor [Arenicella chitinivorans]GHA21391.1 TonB-dependent receptor [Arenicella chitinivorans]